MYCLMLIPYRKRNVEPAPVARSTVYRPSHCPVRRNEQRGSAPRKVYLQRCSLTIGYKCGCTSSMICVITTPYKERSRCFVFNEQFRSCEVLTLSKPKRPENAFFSMFFLAHWQVVARGNHSFAQTVLRHDERWACMLCGVTPSNCFFDLRFISSRHHPFLRAMSPSGQQVGGNRWLSHAR